MTAGLSQLAADAPLWAQVAGGAGTGGTWGRLEAGWHVLPWLDAYGYGELRRDAWETGAGVRASWRW